MFRKKYTLPNGKDNLEAEVVVDIADKDDFFCVLYSVSVINKENNHSIITTYDSCYFSVEDLYKVIMNPKTNFLFHWQKIRDMMFDERALSIKQTKKMPEEMNSLLLDTSERDSWYIWSITTSCENCLMRISEEVNDYYQKVFFENKPFLSRTPADMQSIFEACKNINNFF